MTNEKHDAGAGTMVCILAEQEKDSIGRYCLLCYDIKYILESFLVSSA